MKNVMHFIFIIVLYLGLTFLFTKKARAYLDPGRGSYMLQVVIGGVLGIIMAIKVFWRKIWKSLFQIFQKTKESRREQPENTS